MPDSTVGKGPWRITHSEGKILAIEVWQGAEVVGENEIPAYAYHVTDGAAILYASALYRETQAIFSLVEDEYNDWEQYTDEQFNIIEEWYWLAKTARKDAKHHLLRVTLEG